MGLFQERRNSSVLAMQLRLSCTNLSISEIHSDYSGITCGKYLGPVNLYLQ